MEYIWKWNLKSLSKQNIVTLWKVIRAPLKKKIGLTFFSDFKSDLMSEFRLFSQNADFNLRLKVKVKKKEELWKNVHQFVKNIDSIL